MLPIVLAMSWKKISMNLFMYCFFFKLTSTSRIFLLLQKPIIYWIFLHIQKTQGRYPLPICPLAVSRPWHHDHEAHVSNERRRRSFTIIHHLGPSFVITDHLHHGPLFIICHQSPLFVMIFVIIHHHFCSSSWSMVCSLSLSMLLCTFVSSLICLIHDFLFVIIIYYWYYDYCYSFYAFSFLSVSW